MLSRLVRPLKEFPVGLGQQNALQSFLPVIARLSSTHPVRPVYPRNDLSKPVFVFPKHVDGPERDHVNFPRPKPLPSTPKVYLGWISENYVKFFYPKTGVTGPWVFGGSLTLFMLSKEIYVIEHEAMNWISMALVVTLITYKFGDKIRDYLDKEVDEENNYVDVYKEQQMQVLKDEIEQRKNAMWQVDGQALVYQAKRDNVALQLEGAYRSRLAEVHAAVKKRLDFQVEKINVENNVQQKHMVNWIIGKVNKSITSEQETENVRKCIADLKALASRS